MDMFPSARQTETHFLFHFLVLVASKINHVVRKATHLLYLHAGVLLQLLACHDSITLAITIEIA